MTTSVTPLLGLTLAVPGTNEPFTIEAVNTNYRAIDDAYAGVWRRIAGGTPLAAPAATFDFLAIPQTYRHLKLVLALRGDTAATLVDVNMRFNGDAGGNYNRQFVAFANTTTTGTESLAALQLNGIGQAPAGGSVAGDIGALEVTIPGYADAHVFQPVIGVGFARAQTGSGNMRMTLAGGVWAIVAPVTRIEVIPGAGNWDLDSVATLYGCP